MYEIETTVGFDRWLAKLRDSRAKSNIDMRVRRLARGNPGDTRFVGNGVLELRLDIGPGYRVYYMRRKESVILLLAGGDKGTQDRDIRRAIELAVGIRSQS
jgi:putative addiction module killer protein